MGLWRADAEKVTKRFFSIKFKMMMNQRTRISIIKSLSHKIEKGEMLFLYTDGVTEAENAEKAQYTDKRLLKTVKVNQNQSAGSLIETIASDVKAHVGNTAQSDDITMLAIRFNG